MGDAVGQVLSPAIGVAISPVPLIAIILMLATPRGRTNGIAFTAGWVIGLAAAITALVAIGVGGEASQDGGPATWVSWLKLAIGVLFLLLAFREWRSRPADGKDADMPGWMKRLDSFTAAKSFGLAVLLAVVNPKNLALVISAGVTIAGAADSTGSRAGAAAVFVAIASLCTLVPLGVYLLGGDKAAATLDGWKAWMGRHNAAIMAVVLLVLGMKILGDAVSALS